MGATIFMLVLSNSRSLASWVAPRMLESVRVGFFGGHLVAEASLGHEGGHFGAAAELFDELRVEPGLVDLELGVDEQAVAVEALDVVALVG